MKREFRSILRGIFSPAVLLLLAGIWLTTANSCYYDIEEELYPTITDSCDTTNVTYTETIQPILEQNCYNCHSTSSNTSGILLDNYNAVLQRVNDGSLEGSVNYEPGFSPMPSGAPQLTECDLTKISKWINDGSPDN